MESTKLPLTKVKTLTKIFTSREFNSVLETIWGFEPLNGCLFAKGQRLFKLPNCGIPSSLDLLSSSTACCSRTRASAICPSNSMASFWAQVISPSSEATQTCWRVTSSLISLLPCEGGPKHNRLKDANSSKFIKLLWSPRKQWKESIEMQIELTDTWPTMWKNFVTV